MHVINNKIEHRVRKLTSSVPSFMFGMALGLIILIIVCTSFITIFERQYSGRIYPVVYVGGIPFGGQTQKQVTAYWEGRNVEFANRRFEFQFEQTVATVSAAQIGLGFDAKLSGAQANLVGRSGSMLSDLSVKFLKKRVDLSPLLTWDSQLLDDTLDNIASQIDIPVQDALFSFEQGKVTEFRPSSFGRNTNRQKTLERFISSLKTPSDTSGTTIIAVVVDPIKPQITTDDANQFGVKEIIGRGYSEFAGSIPGRIHNVALAASRMNGVLIKPGEVFSFDGVIGDISAATGYQSAYIIKDGHTVLGDGGGVCQVSSTLFRAALDAGLPIVERHGHAYRVHYYEEGGFKPGLDATVFSPSVDFKFKNDTPGYILIQAKTDTNNLTLDFELYGTHDGRKAEIYNHRVWGESPPPPPLYQDDPTLAPGAVRQVDFAAWGARAAFDYKVTRDNVILENQTFTTIFRPWQAVYLRGPQI